MEEISKARLQQRLLGDGELLFYLLLSTCMTMIIHFIVIFLLVRCNIYVMFSHFPYPALAGLSAVVVCLFPHFHYCCQLLFPWTLCSSLCCTETDTFVYVSFCRSN